MKSIKTTDLRDGMKFDKPVYMDGENVFVPPGIPIRQKDIDRLLRWEIGEVRTDGALVVDTPKALEPTVDLSGFRDLPSGDKANLDSYLRAIDEYEHIASAVAQGEEVDRAKVDATVNLILEKVKDNRNEMVQLILMGGRIERKIAAGIVNVCILSTIMGTILKFTSHRLIQLATGALLYDIGMVKVPKSILKKKDKLSPEELNQIRTHPIHSYRVISKELKYPEEIGVIALQHHEHWDGQGYPRKLRGEDINLSARIVAVADSYIAMINSRPHRNSMIGYSAMKNVLSDNGRHFDPKILKVFLESMGIYPIGSIVQLNNSAIGRVVETHADAPLRPAVELIIDEYGNRRSER
jgi:HD-GYP domain-containing protein (c-di-GMP phosphodiesterase class II)